MSGQTHKKKSGHRKAKQAVSMREDEQRRHKTSGLGHSASRGAPHVGHTRRQQGESFVARPTQPHQDKKQPLGRPTQIRGARVPAVEELLRKG